MHTSSTAYTVDFPAIISPDSPPSPEVSTSKSTKNKMKLESITWLKKIKQTFVSVKFLDRSFNYIPDTTENKNLT